MSQFESKCFSIHSESVWKWLGLGVAAFLFCVPLYSQTSQGSIQGGVFDQTGGVVVGATVSVIDVARGVTRALTTDGAGQYVATGLTPGTYTVRGEAKGFRNVEHSGVLLEVGQNVRVDLVVQPGEQTQTVTVTGEIPAINTTDATLGGTVSNQSINALPLNGRNFERLVQLRPGVVNTPGTGTGIASSNGRRTANDMLRVEGIAEINDSTGSSLLNDSYKGGDASSLISIDAIQEFSSQQNPTAEYGWKDGSFVNVGVKSGTNSLHGTAYAFGRNASATDASNYFSSPGVPAVTPATVEQFGATAGGPILKDKLFWFANYEGLRVGVGDVATDTIPSSVAMANDPNNELSMVNACKALGVAKISGLSAQLAGLNPTTCVVTPASSTSENIFPFLNSTTSNVFAPGVAANNPLNNGLFKADYVIGPHHHLNGMFYDSQSEGSVVASTVLEPQWVANVINNARQYDGNWNWTPNSTWLSDFRLGYVYIRNQTVGGDSNLIPSNPWPNGYGMNTGVTNPLYGGIPSITIGGFTGVLGIGNPRTGRRGPQGNVDLVETVSNLHGNHAFKFGFEYLDEIFDGDAFPGVQGAATFGNLQGFLQGIPSTASIYLGDPTQNTRMHWFSGFFQDDWRIRPRVTLNLGLRYEYYAPPVERSNYLGNFNPNVNLATTPAVQQFGPGAPLASEYSAGLGHVSPRLGVAWDVRGDGKTVVRAGAGTLSVGTILGTLITSTPFGANFFGGTAAAPVLIANNSGAAINLHSPVSLSIKCATSFCAGQWNWNQTGPTVFPSAGAQVINGVTYTGVTCSVATPCQTAGVDPNFLSAYTAVWNVDIQRAITNNVTIDVAYVGNHGFNEETIVDRNQPKLGAGWNTPSAVLGGLTAAQSCLASAPAYNKCTPDVGSEVGQYTSIFPYLSQIDIATNGDFSNYNALQATLQARNYHGLGLIAGYTFAHALSIADTNSTDSSNTLPVDKNNLRLGYGNSNYDIRHRFTLSPNYRIPGMKSPGQMLEGWSINAIITVQTGLPWTAADLTTVDWLGTGEKSNSRIGAGGYQFWNYSGAPSAFTETATAIPCYGVPAGCTPYTSAAYAGAIQTACQNAATAPYGGASTTQGQLALAALANSACYIQNGGVLTPPAYGTLGDAGKGFFRGQNYDNVDFSVLKLWKLKERYSAEFRVEFFNLFNRADFAAPATTNPSSGSGFGTAQATPDSANPVLGSGGPRHIQFGLKLTF
jgi:hypothetical protein